MEIGEGAAALQWSRPRKAATEMEGNELHGPLSSLPAPADGQMGGRTSLDGCGAVLVACRRRRCRCRRRDFMAGEQLFTRESLHQSLAPAVRQTLKFSFPFPVMTYFTFYFLTKWKYPMHVSLSYIP